MKSIIITGASAGIGRAVALRMAQAGWHVGLMARRVTPLETLAEEIGENAIVLPADVTKEAEVKAAFSKYIKAVGHLDCLFNNAGIFVPACPIDELDFADWQRAVDVNLTGMFLAAREAFGQMRRQDPMGGRIINNGSISAYMPREGAVGYTVTKHGVTGLTRQLALDGRPFNIPCGQIDIGNAETDMVRDLAARMVAEGKDPPPTMDVTDVANAVLAMAELPLSTNTLFQTIMANQMPYVGRG